MAATDGNDWRRSEQRFPEHDPQRVSRADAGVVVARARCCELFTALKQELGFDLLVDITCVDYLNYRGARRSLRPGLSAGQHRDRRSG